MRSRKVILGITVLLLLLTVKAGKVYWGRPADLSLESSETPLSMASRNRKEEAAPLEAKPYSFNQTKDIVWHIGDGAFTNSSCRAALNAKEIAGMGFSFHFRVTKEDATVSIRVEDICGVDTPSPVDFKTATNYIILQKADPARDLERHALIPKETFVEFAPRVLEPGDYLVTVDSLEFPVRGVAQSDRDDFMVGNVQIVSNQPNSIILGSVVPH